MTKRIIAPTLPSAAVCTSPSSTSTRRATRSEPDFSERAGASFRMVLDVGNRDASRINDTPDRSGGATNPRHRDLTRFPAAGVPMPLPSTRGTVETGTAEMLKLTP